ncbi:hypothetical protein HYALB_00009621 [Hymenoscyphus albidus]|uniref:Barwin-like endoglucanase n=1 Tax=Hymenoscyphus albidus TaxID=595503 RepID=A0A9N9LUC2_9HELO|nr:hypothetical protein HYALB_00009621 [Hymenoscyphus albidus]
MLAINILSTVAVLASYVSAAALPLDTRATLASGTNAGSIFRFGDAAAAKALFWQSGSCGLSTYFPNTNKNLPLVAMTSTVMSKFGASQHNTLCGKTITMTYKGVTQKAIIADTNVSVDNSIDMTSDVWIKFGGHDGDGTLLKSLTWSISS